MVIQVERDVLTWVRFAGWGRGNENTEFVVLVESDCLKRKNDTLDK